MKHPDRAVIDIDPGEHVNWNMVVKAARLVRELLRALWTMKQTIPRGAVAALERL